MKRKGSLALFTTTASLGEISSRLMLRIIQRQQISCVMILARNAIGKTTYEDMERECIRRVVILHAHNMGHIARRLSQSILT